MDLSTQDHPIQKQFGTSLKGSLLRVSSPTSKQSGTILYWNYDPILREGRENNFPKNLL